MAPLLGLPAAPSFGHQAWSTEDGLPQNTVHALLQTSDGYLWVATEGGLARFDGLSFRTFRRETDPPFPSDDIAALAEDREGTLWIGTTGGLLAWRAGSFKRIALPGNADVSVLALAAAGDGSVLVQTTVGLVRLEHGVAAPAPGLPAEVLALSAAADGGVYLVTASHQLLYRNGVVTPAGSTPAGETPAGLEVAPDGELRLRTTTGLWRREAHGSQPWVPASPLPGRAVNATLTDRSGRTWIATSHGLLLQPSRDAAAVPVGELGARPVLSLLEDREGNLWAGTETDGLHILRAQQFDPVGALRPELADHVVTALAQTSEGRVWIGTRDDGLRLYTPGSLSRSHAPTIDDLPQFAGKLTSPVILALAAGPADDLWVGTLDGLNHLEGGRVSRYTSADGLPDDVIRSLAIDGDGTLWIGTRRGLVRWAASDRHSRRAPAAAMALARVEGLPSDLVGDMLRARASAPGKPGPLWVATLGGVSRVDGGAVINLSTKDGLPPAVITSMAEDGEGRIWIGTAGGGLAALAKGASRVERVTIAGLPDTLNSVIADDAGSLWLGTQRGLFRVRLADLSSCLRTTPLDKTTPCAPPLARFGYADGMPTEQTTAAGHPAALRAADGRLWFATARGVAVLNPAHLRQNSVPPPVAVERFLVDNVAQAQEGPDAAPLRLPFRRGSLTFDYAGLSFTASGRVAYRYQLEGFDRVWTEAGTRRSAYYTNLPPGSYSFRVQAANNDGVWNRTGAVLRFVILPPFYRRLWFYLLVLLLCAGLIYGIYTLRVRGIRSEFNAVLGERGRIAREIHDTLAQNFVGITINLQVAEQLLSANNLAGTRDQLKQTQELAQEGLNDARQSIWALRASTSADSLPTRLSRAVERMEARAERGGAGVFRTEVKIGGIYRALDPALENELLRIAGEALANITRHAHATEARVELRYGSDRLYLEVKDNGRGFDPDAISTAGGDHFGLEGMRERAAALGATLSVRSAAGAGTTITLDVPVSRAERHTV